MLSHKDLASELEALARHARTLANGVRSDGADMSARQLALGVVEVGKIGDKLTRLQRQLGCSNGREGA